MKSKCLLCLALASLLLSTNGIAADAPKLGGQEIPLWPAGAPGSEGKTAKERWITRAEAVPGEEPAVDALHRVTDIHNPSITVFLPPKQKATGAAFIIAPGGGHRYLVFDLEGTQIAQRLNKMGIAAFVLKNRLARARESTYKVGVESFADSQRAIRMVRNRSKEWGVNPTRVGFMGFSAGGELATLVSTRYDTGQPDATDPVERQSSRPDFITLIYPGLRLAELNVTKDTPPTFIMVAHDDAPAKNSAEYYVKLKQAGVPAELHIFRRGGHGFGMDGRTPEFRKLPVANWADRLQEWLADQGLLN